MLRLHSQRGSALSPALSIAMGHSLFLLNEGSKMLIQGAARYFLASQAAADRANGSNILVITHGEVHLCSLCTQRSTCINASFSCHKVCPSIIPCRFCARCREHLLPRIELKILACCPEDCWATGCRQCSNKALAPSIRIRGSALWLQHSRETAGG